MKRIAIALVLALMLIMLLGTPALAWELDPPENGPINMPESGEDGLENASNHDSCMAGGYGGAMSGYGHGHGSPKVYGCNFMDIHMDNIQDGYAPGDLNNYLMGRGKYKNSN